MTELQRCSMCKCNKLLSLFKVRANTGKILKTCIKCCERPKDYSKSVIYKIESKDENLKDNIYVGSSRNFIKRKTSHKESCNNLNSRLYNMELYKFIRSNGGFHNWNIIEIEQYEATDKRDLDSKEMYWIELLKPILNKNASFRTEEQIKQYYEKYREEHKQEKKQYDEEHKQDKKQYDEKYREEHKEHYEKYREEHKQDKKQYDKKRREENKEKIRCEECDIEINKTYLKAHKITKKHLKNVL